MDFEEITISGNDSGSGSGLTEYQFSVIVGEGDFTDFTFTDALGLYFVGIVAGFALASLPLIIKKAIKDVRHILTKSADV